MRFQFEHSATGQWPRLQAEHDLLQQWVRQRSHRSDTTDLQRRVVDADRKAAIYCGRAFGMGDGHDYVLVWAGSMVWFTALRARFSADYQHARRDILSIRVPQAIDDQRDVLCQLIADGLTAWDQHDDDFLSCGTQLTVGFEKTRWEVRPTPYSRLYWSNQVRRRWPAFQRKLQAAQRLALSPLLAMLLVLGSFVVPDTMARIPPWCVALLILWLCLRVIDYDAQGHFWPWMLGTYSPKSALQSMADFHQAAIPVPLKALTLHIARDAQTPHTCTFTLKNRSFFFVPYISLAATDIADLVAPGFVDSLRASNAGRVDPTELQRTFTGWQRQWLLPLQRVQWQVPLLEQYPLEDPPTQVVCLVKISRWLTGQRRTRPCRYLLTVSHSQSVGR